MSLKSNLISTTYSTDSSDDKFDQGVGGPTGGAALGSGGGKASSPKCFCWVKDDLDIRIYKPSDIKTTRGSISQPMMLTISNLKEVMCEPWQSGNTKDTLKVNAFEDSSSPTVDWEVFIHYDTFWYCGDCENTDYGDGDVPGSPLTRKKCPSKKKLCDYSYDGPQRAAAAPGLDDIMLYAWNDDANVPYSDTWLKLKAAIVRVMIDITLYKKGCGSDPTSECTGKHGSKVWDFCHEGPYPMDAHRRKCWRCYRYAGQKPKCKQDVDRIKGKCPEGSYNAKDKCEKNMWKDCPGGDPK